MQKRSFILLLVGLALLLSAAPVLAQDGTSDDQVVVGQSFTLASGERLNGNLAVVGGSADIEEEATLAGDMAVFGGAVRIAGRVTGDVVAFGGSVELASTANVRGDLVVLGGTLTRAPGATVGGEVQETRRPSEFFRNPTVPFVIPQAAPTTPTRFLFDALTRTLGAIGLSLVLATLGVLAVVLLPKQTERVAEVLVGQPAIALAAGVLTWLVLAGLVVILTITICLAPLALLLSMLVALAWLLGWITAGWLVGQRLLHAFNLKKVSPLLEAIVGVVLITLLWRVIPYIGWLFWFVVSSLGLGAVVLALFGRQSPASRPGANATALLPTTPAAPASPPTPAAPTNPPVPWYEGIPGGLVDDMALDAEPPPTSDAPPR
jgi:cytoskeletal protein CcmA (bactofilin family)